MKTSNLIIIALFTATQLGLVSCSDNNPINPDNPDDDNQKNELYTTVLTNDANIITQTYVQLNDEASNLTVKAQNLSVGDEVALEAAKEAWKNARAPWEKSEGFIFGPVENLGIDPAVDSWPVDINAINNILNSGDTINSSVLETNNEARGFHTLEYFLWGINGDKTASELTNREIEYIVAAAKNLENKSQQLANAWLPSGGNFANVLVETGPSNPANYTSQKVALKELVEGMQGIANEVAVIKIENPLNGNGGNPKPNAEESRFSHNSKLDFANNIRSIQNIYLGQFNGVDSKGMSAVIAEQDASLDAEITAAISDAISAIEAIPGTFTDAIQNNREAVENAQGKVLELSNMLQDQALPVISNL